MTWRRIAEELATLRHPRTLRLGVVSGFALTACFIVLAGFAIGTGVLPWHWYFAALLGAKLVTNTLAWIALRTGRFALALGALNVAMDPIVMTGAIWVTGDTGSPLVAIYTIEVTVLALLTNLGATVLIGTLALVLYMAMGIATATGALPRFPTPAAWSGGTGVTYLALVFVFAAFVIITPTLYIARILRRQRDNERGLEARTRALIDAGREKAQFMANVSHELRTPLQGIVGLSELMAKGILGDTTERQRAAMVELKASAIKLRDLIDDLLQLASYDAGKLDVKLTRVAVADLVPAWIASGRRLLAGKTLTLEHELAPDLPVIVTDRGKLNQIVLNLVSNAIKFTPEGGRITVRARRCAEIGVEIEVEDDGIGIPAGERERIFEEFHQVDGSPSREHGGAGIGLAVVRRLVPLLGGAIAVHSDLGRGSRFVVMLPDHPG